MLLTLDTSPTIVRRHNSRVKKEIHFAYVSLSPSPGTASPVNHLSCKAIDSFLGMVTRRPTASAPLPKPPDPWHSEPREPSPPDPPPCPPDSPFKAHRTPSPLTEPQNNHPNDSSLSTNSSRAKSDVNPAHSRWRWSPASALAALGHDDQDGDPTRKPSPSINPPCISSPVVAQKLAGGLTRKSPPLFQSVSFSSLGGLLGLVFEDSIEGLAHGVSLGDFKSISMLSCVRPFVPIGLVSLLVAVSVPSAKFWQVRKECKTKKETLVTRTEASVTLSPALEDCIRISSVRSESLQVVRALALGSKVFKLHGLVHDSSCLSKRCGSIFSQERQFMPM